MTRLGFLFMVPLLRGAYAIWMLFVVFSSLGIVVEVTAHQGQRRSIALTAISLALLLAPPARRFAQR